MFRFVARTLVVALVMLFGYLGWTLAISSTSEPGLDVGSPLADSITVSSDEQNVEVQFKWSMNSAGTVQVEVGTGLGEVRNDVGELILGGNPGYREAGVYISFYCDSRFSTWVDNSTPPAQPPSITTGGSEADCTSDGSSSNLNAKPARMVVRFSYVLDITILPTKNWSNAGSASRVARSPQVEAGSGPVVTADGASVETFVPAATSTFETRMSASDLEYIDSVVPEQVQHGSVEINGEGVLKGPTEIYEFVAVQRRVNVGEFEIGDAVALRSGTARWSDPAKQTNAQRDLVLSGVFLGLAAAGVLEFLIAMTRGEKRTKN